MKTSLGSLHCVDYTLSESLGFRLHRNQIEDKRQNNKNCIYFGAYICVFIFIIE